MSCEARLVGFKILKDLRSCREARELVKVVELLRLFVPVNIVRTFISAVRCPWTTGTYPQSLCFITVYWILLVWFDLFPSHLRVFKHLFSFGCRT